MSPDTGRPRVSVVIGAYNASRWIRETIDSVLGQTYRDFELIVVDDGSTDDTPAVVAGYGDAVRYVAKENGGAASARNAGVRNSRGHYVAFLDHDDLWLPQKLERQMALFDRRPDLVWSYTDALYFDSDTGAVLHRSGQTSRLHEGDVLRPLLLGDFIPFATAVVRRDLFDEVGYFQEGPDYVHVDDWDLWLRIARTYPVGCVPEPLIRYRVHRVQASRTLNPERALQNRLRVINEAVARDPDRLSGVHRQATANVYLTVGRIWLSREQQGPALRSFARAVANNPMRLPYWVYLLTGLVPRRARTWLGRLRQVFRAVR